MLALFLLRLALGMLLALLVLSPGRTARATPQRGALVSASFFRAQLLVVLGLCLGTALWLGRDGDALVLGGLILAACACLLGSVSWSLERSPGALFLLAVALISLLVALPRQEVAGPGFSGSWTTLAGSYASALLLGAATSAMLLGHNYLVWPSMAMTPLFRLLILLVCALTIRMLGEILVLGAWMSREEIAHMPADETLWLMVRWLVGLGGPAFLTWMAWQTAKIRSTQSATGILYVVVIFCFVGELTGVLLRPGGLSL
ncbi:MAG: hypothetical protein U0840_25230 [Gemmataceae bacterium]